ncbi:HemK methyltransferase member 2 [Coemansia sp. RSA 2599]|nr:HemK methyltransferase member 2 [Coemansia sp. RSA 2598]KAJ1817780.1 HemK methyltransferase member 2 [Coemansia sp. RSA 2599]
MGIPTPDTSHLRDAKYASVYEPAEDTYLLLDALENDRAELQRLQPTICVEIGSGSGCVSAFLGQVLDPSAALVLSTDINPAATEATRQTAARTPSAAVFEQCRTRFVQALVPRLCGNIDLLLFNPPYVVTPSDEIDVTQEASAWAGGKDGREVLDRLLPHIPQLLAPAGRFYLVVIEENKPLDIIDYLSAHGLSGKRVLQRRAGRENLSILRFIKNM